MRRTIYAITVTGLVTGLCAVAPTQMPTGPRPSPGQVPTRPQAPEPQSGPEPIATIHFQTNIGSFKTIDSAGKITMTFKGTVLLSKYVGTPPKFEGNVQQQYNGHDRLVYFGAGKMTVDGKWRAIQWFGRDLKAEWTGHGMIRLVGEFDKNLNTGTYYYDDPKRIAYWPTSIMPAYLPERKLNGNVEPKERPQSKPSGSK